MDAIECYRMKNGNKLSIYRDDDAENPFTNWDHEGVNLYWLHRRSEVSEKGYNFTDLDSCLQAMARDLIPEGVPGSAFLDSCDRYGFDRDDTVKLLDLAAKYAYILPVYCYEHGGMTIRTSGFCDRWDSGQTGWIAIRKADFTQIYLSKKERRLPAESRAKRAAEMLESWIETIDQWLTGEVYAFTIENQTGECVDSCFGFFGSDHEKSGLLDHVGLTRGEFRALETWTGPDEYPSADPEDDE